MPMSRTAKSMAESYNEETQTNVPLSRRNWIQSLTTLGTPPFSPLYPIRSSNGTPKMLERVGIGRVMLFSCFRFSLGSVDLEMKEKNNITH